jgi:glutathione S-transferase
MTPRVSPAHHCPWARRAQIALRELCLEFKSVLVDINATRTPEYLAINPCGLVPALVYVGHVVTESGFITQFLVDSNPSYLLKSSSESGGALQ